MPQRILGIDIGSKTSRTAFALVIDTWIESINDLLPQTSKESFNTYLNRLYTTTLVTIKNTKPDFVVIEEAFLQGKANKRFNRAMGVIQLAIGDIPILFLAPLSIKKLVTGTGKATKQEVAVALKTLFKGELLPSLIREELWDSIDAIATSVAGRVRLTNEKST